MSEEFDIEKISGHEYMDEDDISYFKKFGYAMADQAEVIMDHYNIDSETMRYDYDAYMDNLTHDLSMYIVEGAPLVCTMQDNAVRTFKGKTGDIISIVDEEKVTEMATLRIVEDREANLGDFIPAVVTDAKGGLRDKAQKPISIKDENSLNIVSFGNCKNIPDKSNLRTLAEGIHRNIPYPDDAWSTDLIEDEMERAIEQGKGICHCCMLLNPEWENLPAEYDFITKSFDPHRDSEILPVIGFNSHSYQQINGKEQINMMSMLFCQRGGIITAQKSGQQEQSAYKFKYDWAKEKFEESVYVTPEFMARVVEIAEKYGFDPDDLMAVMAWESRFNPKAEAAGGGCGLIQFTNISIQEINKKYASNGFEKNYTKADIRKMDAMQQLELVDIYFGMYADQINDLGDLYVATIAPSRLGNENDNYDLYTVQGSPDNYKANKGLDKNNDGKITKEEAVQVVLDRREEYLFEK